MIDDPNVFVFFGNVNWTTDDIAPLIEDWGDGQSVMNRVFNVEILDADGNQLLYMGHTTASSTPNDPSYARALVTAVEVTGASGAFPDPPGLEFGEESATTIYDIPAPDPDPNESPVTGGYVRHRNRMISQSLFEDVRDTLIACRWMPGTTSHEVFDPEAGGAWQIVTTTEDDVLGLLEGQDINLIDYFPESKGKNVAGQPDTGKTPPNTLAVDVGVPGEAVPRELGSTAQNISYTFMLAFFGTSDAVAQALLSDLQDRYFGRLVRFDSVSLWDYNNPGPKPVVQMDVESFTYRPNSGETSTPAEVFLYFAELVLTDEID